MKRSKTMAKSARIISPFQRFFQKFVQGSYPLFAAAVAAVIWVNISHETYHGVWHTEVAFSLGSFQISRSIAHWIDEALMAVFFFAVGLEIKREFLVGELSSAKKALLPVMAALGGMIVPAAIYAIFNYHTPSAKGWGIPMATDIAFSLAVLALLGRRIPFGIKLFLSAFAIADDLGAVIVIALFYTASLNWSSLMVGGVFVIGLFIANRLWVRSSLVYLLLGIGLWFCILKSGVHATVAGVLVAMFIPARAKYDTDVFIKAVEAMLDKLRSCEASCGFSILLNREHLNAVQAIDLACRDVETPLQQLEHTLEPWIAYVILPLFALANSGILFEGFDFLQAVSHPITLGVFAGLVLGKPVGIALFSLFAIEVFNIRLTSGVTKRHVIGVSFLGGIGFTMSLFITGLSFVDPEKIALAKFAIVFASILSGILGFLVLRGSAATIDHS
jgi:Na+:H+ antiporter, NhaA family